MQKGIRRCIKRNRAFHLKFHFYAKKLRELAASKGVRFPHALAKEKPRYSGLFACFGLIVTEKCCTKKARYFGIFERSRKPISLFISLFWGKIFCNVIKIAVYERINVFSLPAECFLIHAFHGGICFPPAPLHGILIGDIKLKHYRGVHMA